jgi:hypothetical protein
VRASGGSDAHIVFSLWSAAAGGRIGRSGRFPKKPYSPRDKAFYADKALVDFVNPGLTITINSAKISSAGVISVVYTLADPNGLPLDAAGVTTPGAISLAYVAAYIPKGQEQYVAYTTAPATGKALGTITRPDFELGGTATQIGPGQYQYTFNAQAPSGFDPDRRRPRSQSTGTAASPPSASVRTMPAPPSTSFPMARRLPSLVTSSAPKAATRATISWPSTAVTRTA